MSHSWTPITTFAFGDPASRSSCLFGTACKRRRHSKFFYKRLSLVSSIDQKQRKPLSAAYHSINSRPWLSQSLKYIEILQREALSSIFYISLRAELPAAQSQVANMLINVRNGCGDFHVLTLPKWICKSLTWTYGLCFRICQGSYSTHREETIIRYDKQVIRFNKNRIKARRCVCSHNMYIFHKTGGCNDTEESVVPFFQSRVCILGVYFAPFRDSGITRPLSSTYFGLT